MVPFLLGLSLLGAPITAEAAGPAACARIDAPLARLACFDRWFPAGTGDREEPAAPAPVPPGAPRNVPDPRSPPSTPTEASERSLERTDPVPPQAPGSGRAPPSPEEPADGVLRSTVTALRNQQQRLVFELANGQVWMQTAPRPLSVAAGEAVTVRATLFGGHLLRTESGATTRVRRVD